MLNIYSMDSCMVQQYEEFDMIMDENIY